MREYDAYLFDADGTIIDTREMIFTCFVHAAEAMGIAAPSRDHVMATTGLPMTVQIRRLYGGEWDDDFYGRAGDVYRDRMMAVYPDYLATFPGVVEGLEKLAAGGKKLAVVTSRRRHTLDVFLRELGLDRFFPVVVTPDDTDRHKPNPEPALLAMRLLGAEPGKTLFVGDAEFDILCGKAAGTDTAYVAWGGMEYAAWPVQPDFVVNRFEDLLPQ